MSPRMCIFCGRSPTTQEHVWPDWIRRLVSDAPPLDYHRELVSPTLEQEQSWRQGAFALTVGAVCAGCNNGWMAALEKRAQRWLEPMLRGHSEQLDYRAQETLATWALKTALIVEQTASGYTAAPQVFPRAMYAALKTELRPPEPLQIWSAAYEGTYPGYASVSRAPAAGEEPATAYAATLVLGRALFYVLGGDDEAMDHATPAKQMSVLQIWPYRRERAWDPTPVFDDRLVAELSDALG